MKDDKNHTDRSDSGVRLEAEVTQHILHLTLAKRWFDLIASGKKTTEFREFKEYWVRRLMNGLSYKKFDEIHFTNGYGKDKPFMRVKHLETLIRHKSRAEAQNGEELSEYIFAILLGRIIEIKNY